tara:strand:+ start:1288 stop:1506 length:219 start_codon:yes stop_codon:yes gene_type:complete
MIIKILKNLKPDSEIDQNTVLLDNLLDSFDLLNLIMEIENVYNIQIPVEDINDEIFKTVTSLQEYLRIKHAI